MSDYRANRLRRDILEDLWQQGRFADFVLLAWGIIEHNLDNVILREYGLSSQNPKSDLLIRLNIKRKLDLQKNLSYLTTEQYKKVKQFQEWRNKFFHRSGVFVFNISESEKNEVMYIAMKAVDVTHDLFELVSK